MSRTIDERVVSLEFDNKKFETNVSATMSTLDKLKQKLQFKGSSQAFYDINNAAKSVDLNGLITAADNLRLKFNAMDVAGVTALVNIANTAVTAGKRMLESLTVAPISTGFKEYETQLNSVQTILANTQSKGSTLEDVNAALAELNTYADKTIYNFTQMTRNIGTFTAAGVGLEKSVTAIKGIANLAAVSGSSSMQASTVMYQLSQALAAGRVSLMDWNSVVNGGMGGELFQNALKRTARNMGKDVDGLIEKYGSFRESLTQGQWLTTDVLTETLTQISGAYSEADLLAQGYTESQAKEIIQLAETAVNAATKVKTFTQLMDTANEAVGSGWAQTWQIIFGDFEEAKTLWTGISESLNSFIGQMSDSRNALLEGAFGGLGEDFNGIADKMNSVGVSTEDFTNKIKDLASKSGITSDEFDEIVNKSGSLARAFRDGSLSTSLLTDAMDDFGVKGGTTYDFLIKKINDAGIETEDFESKIRELAIASGMTGEEFDKILTETGSLASAFRRGRLPIELVTQAIDQLGVNLDNVTAPISGAVKGLEEFQNAVNKTIRGDFGNGAERINKLTEAGYNHAIVQDLVQKVWERNGKTWKDTTITSEDLTEAINKLSDEELKNIGYTRDQADGLKELAAQADKSGVSIDELIDSLDQRTGRELLIDGLSNIATSIGRILGSIKTAWSDAFPPLASSSLYNILKGFYDLTSALVITESTADKLTRTLKGVFAILDIITMVAGGGLSIVFKVATTAIKALWQALGLGADSLLDITASIGDTIVAFRDWIESNNLLNAVIEKGIPFLVKMGVGFVNLVTALWDLPVVQGAIDAFTSSISTLWNIIDTTFGPAISAISDFIDEVGQLQDVNLDDISAAFDKLKTSLWNWVTTTDFMSIGSNLIDGIILGIQNGVGALWTSITTVAEGIINKIKEILGIHSPSTKGIEIGIQFVTGIVIGIIDGIKLLWEAASTIVETLIEVLGGVDLTDILAIGVIGVATVSIVKLTKVIGNFLDSISKIGNVFDGISGVFKSLSKYIDAKSLNVKADSMKTIATAILIMAAALVILTQAVNYNNFWPAMLALGVLVGTLIGIQFVASKIDLKSFQSIAKVAGMLISIGITVGLIANAFKKIGDIEKFDQAIAGVAAIFVGMIALLGVFAKIAKTKGSSDISKVGTMFLQIAIAMGILAKVMQTFAGFTDEQFKRGGGTCILIGIFLAAFIKAISGITAGKALDKIGNMFLKMIVAMGLLALVIKLIGTIDLGALGKATALAVGSMIIFGMFGALGKILETVDISKFTNDMLKWAGSMAILAIAIKILGGMNGSDIGQAIVAIFFVSLIFVALSAVIKKCQLISDGMDILGDFFLKLGASFSLIAIAMRLLGNMSSSEISKALSVLVGVGLVFTAFIAVSKLAGQHADKAGSMIMKMSVGFLAVAFVFRLLRGLSQEDINKGYSFMIGVGAIFSVLILVSNLAGQFGDKAGAMIGKMVAPIIALGVMIAVLSLFDQSKIQSATLCMSLLMGMFSIMMIAFAVMAAMTNQINSAQKMLFTMVGVTAILGLIIAGLSFLPMDNAITSAIALSTLMLALSAALVVIGYAKAPAAGAMISLLAMSGIVAILAIILGTMAALDAQPSIETAMALSLLLLTMTAVFAALTVLGAIGGAALVGTANFMLVVTALGAMLFALGGLMNLTNGKLGETIMKGIQLLQDIAAGLGGVIGAFVGGIAEGFMARMPTMGQYLTDFMTNAQGFIDGASNIDAASMQGIQALADAILTLTGADIINSISSLFGGGKFDSFNEESLTSLGNSINAFSKSVADVDAEKIRAAAEAINLIGSISTPRSGGLLQGIIGESLDFETFGTQMGYLAEGLKDFIGVVGETTDYSMVTSAAQAIQQIADIKLPTTTGLLQQLVGGEMPMDTFATQIESLATGLVNFINKIAEIDDYSKVELAATAIQKIADIELPTENGLFSILTGETMSMKTFSNQIQFLGTGLKDFHDKVSEISDFEKVNRAISAVSRLANTCKGLEGFDSAGIDSFVGAIKKLSEVDYAGFANAFDESSLSGITSMGTKLVESLVSGINANVGDAEDAAANLVSAVKTKLDGLTSDFTSCGIGIVAEVANGISENTDAVETAMGDVAEAAANEARSERESFYSAGMYLVQGFADGISVNTYLATAKAKVMASSAKNAAMLELDEHSPSKEFFTIGKYVPMGFANAISKFTRLATVAASKMARSTIDETRFAMASIGSLLDSDMDYQPTIRPIMDLTDVSAGAKSISNMLGTGFGVMANIRAINSASNSRIQNGVNGDVISAIDKLRGAISGTSGDTYNINGITYDDGSNITEAVKTLVRAARIDKRV